MIFLPLLSRTPLLPEPYDSETVLVKPSGIPFAGEGLYARRFISEGELVCLFSGVRVDKVGHCRTVHSGEEGWSDYRLTLGKMVL